MSQFKHTPGPWFGRPDHDPVLLQGCADVGLSIAFSCGGGNPKRDEYMANARLIAAAPELLEALQKLVDSCADSDGAQYGTLGTSFVRSIATAAIAKATGEAA